MSAWTIGRADERIERRMLLYRTQKKMKVIQQNDRTKRILEEHFKGTPATELVGTLLLLFVVAAAFGFHCIAVFWDTTT